MTQVKDEKRMTSVFIVRIEHREPVKASMIEAAIGTYFDDDNHYKEFGDARIDAIEAGYDW